MDKAQIQGQQFVYILIGIVSVIILAIGVQQFVKMDDTGEDVQLINFATSLNNEIKTIKDKPFGSEDSSSFSVPSKSDFICFVDRSKEINFLVKNELKGKVDTYSDKNLFIAPFDKFNNFNLEGFELDEKNNPLCVKNVNGKVRLTFESKGDKSLISAGSEEVESECVTVLNNGEDKIDVVFLGYGYNDPNVYKRYVDSYTNDVLFSVEPFSYNKDKINVFRVDDRGLDCTIGDYITCNEFQAKQLASKCGADYIIVLVDRNKVVDFLSPVRSSARGNVVKVNTADDSFVLMHELGHAIGFLADEYVDDYYKNMKFNPNIYPNCGSNCKWASITGECFGGPPDNDKNGCSIDTARRGTETSLMKELNVESFGPVNEYYLQRELDEYS